MNVKQSLRPLLLLTILFTGFLLLGLALAPAAVSIPVAQISHAGWTEIGSGSASGGGITSSNNNSRQPTLVTYNDTAILSYTEQEADSGSEIYVKQWNGSEWVAFSSGSDSNGGISNTSGNSRKAAIALDPNGWPAVSWQDSSTGEFQIYVKRWNGSAWVQMGGSATGPGISNTAGPSINASLAITPDGIVVTWQAGEDEQSSKGYQIYVRRWNEGKREWEEMGQNSASGGIGLSNTWDDATSPVVAVGVGGNPLVAWAESYCDGYNVCRSNIFLKRWNGKEWLGLGGSAMGRGISDTDQASSRPFLAVALDGSPIVAWEEEYCNYGGDDINQCDLEIYLKKWDGKNWVELGNSATRGGISDNDTESRLPWLAIDPDDGSPVIAWADGRDCDGGPCEDEIYVRRWNGSQWVEMDAGSAFGGGISQNITGFSVAPSLVFNARGIAMVAWTHRALESGDYDQIYARRYATCYPLSLNHTGQGEDPVTSPTNSQGCPPGTFIYGEKIVLTARPASGWRVVDWSGTDDNYSTAETNSLTMTENSRMVTVNYAAGCYMLALRHTGQGSDPVATPDGSPECSTGSYKAGEQITLTAKPADKWLVASWAGTNNNASTAETNSLTMPGDNHAVTVHYYTAGCYMLTLRHTGQGSDPVATPDGSPECSTGSYKAGEQITLTAKPADKWLVAGWVGTDNNASTADSNSLIMPPSDHTVSVEYASTYSFIPLIRYGCFDGPEEYEPNNNIGQAKGPLCAGRLTTVKGLPNDEYDYFKLETTHARRIIATVKNHYGDGPQISLSKLDEKNPNRLIIVGSDTEAGDGLLIDLQIEPGTYFLVIYTEVPDPGETRQYVLEVDIR